MCGVKRVGKYPSLQGVMWAFGPKRLVFGTFSGSSCNEDYFRSVCLSDTTVSLQSPFGSVFPFAPALLGQHLALPVAAGREVCSLFFRRKLSGQSVAIISVMMAVSSHPEAQFSRL